jgi:hypothetical protein
MEAASSYPNRGPRCGAVDRAGTGCPCAITISPRPLKIFGILVTFWAVMAARGLVVEGLCAGLGLMPHHRSTRIVETSSHWNYTTFLNIGFLVVFAGLHWLCRNRDRLGGGQGFGIDPVCGMQVRTAKRPSPQSTTRSRRLHPAVTETPSNPPPSTRCAA